MKAGLSGLFFALW